MNNKEAENSLYKKHENFKKRIRKENYKKEIKLKRKKILSLIKNYSKEELERIDESIIKILKKNIREIKNIKSLLIFSDENYDIIISIGSNKNLYEIFQNENFLENNINIFFDYLKKKKNNEIINFEKNLEELMCEIFTNYLYFGFNVNFFFKDYILKMIFDIFINSDNIEIIKILCNFFALLILNANIKNLLSIINYFKIHFFKEIENKIFQIIKKQKNFDGDKNKLFLESILYFYNIIFNYGNIYLNFEENDILKFLIVDIINYKKETFYESILEIIYFFFKSGEFYIVFEFFEHKICLIDFLFENFENEKIKKNIFLNFNIILSECEDQQILDVI